MHINTSLFISAYLGQHQNSAVNSEDTAPTVLLTALKVYTGLCLSGQISFLLLAFQTYMICLHIELL